MVRVRLFAALREAADTAEAEAPGKTVGDVVDALSARFGERFAAVAAVSSFVVNGERAARSTPIAEGDEVALLPPVSGGRDRRDANGSFRASSDNRRTRCRAWRSSSRPCGPDSRSDANVRPAPLARVRIAVVADAAGSFARHGPNRVGGVGARRRDHGRLLFVPIHALGRSQGWSPRIEIGAYATCLAAVGLGLAAIQRCLGSVRRHPRRRRGRRRDRHGVRRTPEPAARASERCRGSRGGSCRDRVRGRRLPPGTVGLAPLPAGERVPVARRVARAGGRRAPWRTRTRSPSERRSPPRALDPPLGDASTGVMTARLGDLADRTPSTRDRYVDFLRAVSILSVVIGHWTIAMIIWDGGSIRSTSAIGVTSWLWLATWFLQVMPIFFFVGGFANLVDLRRVRARGESTRSVHPEPADAARATVARVPGGVGGGAGDAASGRRRRRRGTAALG